MVHIPGPRPIPAVVLSRDLGHDAARERSRPPGLIRVRRGAFVVGPLPEERWAQREMLALAACAAAVRQFGSSVLSHESAALVHGAWVPWTSGLTHLTSEARPGAHTSADVKRHVAALPASDITVVNGLPVTTLARTAVDCARLLPARVALPVVDSILRRLCTPDRFARPASEDRIEEARRELQDRLDDYRGARGVVRARAVVAAADPFAESPGETDLRWVALAHGLPRPAAQLAIRMDSVSYYADLGWVLGQDGNRHVVVAEFDGAGKYRAEAGDDAGSALYEEKIREDALRAAGIIVHRFVARDLRQPRAAFARLCRGFPSAVVAGAAPVAVLLDLPSRLRSRADARSPGRLRPEP